MFFLQLSHLLEQLFSPPKDLDIKETLQLVFFQLPELFLVDSMFLKLRNLLLTFEIFEKGLDVLHRSTSLFFLFLLCFLYLLLFGGLGENLKHFRIMDRVILLHLLLELFFDIVEIEICSQDVLENKTCNLIVFDNANNLLLSFGVDNELVDDLLCFCLFEQLEILNQACI